MIKRSISIVILFTIYYLLFTIPAWGFTMEGGGFRLEVPDILGEKYPTSPKDQPEAGQPMAENPRIIRPAQPNVPFTFTISTLLVDFGVIFPTDPVTRTANLIVQSDRAGFTVQALQNHPLMNSENGEIIPDTTCDTGGCGVTLAGPWFNPLVYGSGFRADNVQGGTSTNIFSLENSFAQLADLEVSESSSILMSNLPRLWRGDRTRNDEIRLTFKVNVAGSQKTGVYQNVIHFITIPNF